jgi:signal transduction histidine kinase
MNKALKSLFECILFFVLAWTTNVFASDVSHNIKVFYDDSSALQLSEISESQFGASTGQIRQPYQKGNFWLKVEISEWQPNSYLYFENPSIDEVLIFKKDPAETDTWNVKSIPLKQLLHGYALYQSTKADINRPIVFYLRIKTSAPKQFNVLILSEKEVSRKENLKLAVLSSQMTAAAILMIWVAMQNWLARSKIFITVMLAVPMFVLSRVNYFGFFLNGDTSNSVMYLNLNMVLFSSLISGGTLMVKESFGRLFSKQQDRYFLALFGLSFVPALGLVADFPRALLVTLSLLINFAMVASLFVYLRTIFKIQKELIWHYKFQLIIFTIYALMSVLPGLYFIAPQIFPFTLGIPSYRDFFYPVLAFLIMALMLNEQKEKEMDSIFKLAVTKANADLEVEKNKKQHLFLGMLLHEIKTPLSVIKFGAAALSKDASKSPIWAQRVDIAADAINHILNQCLLADKFEFGLSGYRAEKLEIHPEISKLVERIGYLNPTYPERIEFQIDDQILQNTAVSVDPVFLRSILENLMTNALKYSSINSKIYLSVLTKPSEGKDVIEIIIKNQIGKVGPPQIDKIFSRYYRAEEAQGYSGTGLGLWLANQQATEMGTRIQCSFDDMWTQFSFQLRKVEDRS